MKTKLAIGILLVMLAGLVVVVALRIYFNSPLMSWLVVIYSIGGEAVLWWVIDRTGIIR